MNYSAQCYRFPLTGLVGYPRTRMHGKTNQKLRRIRQIRSLCILARQEWKSSETKKI